MLEDVLSSKAERSLSFEIPVTATDPTTVNRIASISGSSSMCALASAVIPKPVKLNSTFRHIVAFSDVSNEGDLGTLSRTASALGYDHIVYLENCADMFSVKSVRASQGALWKIPYSASSTSQLVEFARVNKLRLCQIGSIPNPGSLTLFDMGAARGAVVLVSPIPKKNFGKLDFDFAHAPMSIRGSCFIYAMLETLRKT